jgi:amino-acid N-acetyltransferase
MKHLFVLTTQTGHWFQEHGYEPGGPEQLPEDRRALYDPARNSKVLFKAVTA